MTILSRLTAMNGFVEEPKRALRPAGWSRLVLVAIALYCAIAVTLILQRPGPHYDETLFVLGSVHMLKSAEVIDLPHDPDTWICLHGRCAPLMTLRYAGAIKEYLMLPFNAMFGPRIAFLRLLSMILGALGIWGLAMLIREHVDPRAAVVTAFVLALHPAFVNQTVFDSGGVAPWMGAMGLLCWTLSRYLRLTDKANALWLGLSMGFGVWTRANFLWLLAAVFCGAVLVLRKRFRVPRSHVAFLAAGAGLGGFPFLLYQVISRGGTWEALGMFTSEGSVWHKLFIRSVLLSETLLYDREHRAMWDAPALPEWQRWLFVTIVLVGCAICFHPQWKCERAVIPRAFVLASVVLGTYLLLSRLDVSEHHLIVLIPLLAAAVGFAYSEVAATHKAGMTLAGAIGILYAGVSLYWHYAAAEGLRKTGGVRLWSDSSFTLATDLQNRYAGREIKILDWGLQNNLYFLTAGKLVSREIFGNATEEVSGLQRPWAEEIRTGGVFVLNGPSNRQFPAATAGFLRALQAMQPPLRRYTVPQRNGAIYAEVFDIDPNSSRELTETIHSSFIRTNDPRSASLIDGFHQIEENSWRWSKRNFSFTMQRPKLPNNLHRVELVVSLHIPEVVIQRLGSLTLTAYLQNRSLGSATYTQAGAHSYSQIIEEKAMNAGPNRFRFTLDKALPPTTTDARELGVIVTSASLAGR